MSGKAPHAAVLSVCSFPVLHCTDPEVCASLSPQVTALACRLTHIPFSYAKDWDSFLERLTPPVPLWSTPGTVPWDGLHMTGLETDQHLRPGFAMGGYTWTLVSPPPSHTAVFPELSAPTLEKPLDAFGFGSTGRCIWLTALSYVLSARQKPGFVLGLDENLALGFETCNCPSLCPVPQVDVTSVHSPTGLPWMRLVQAAANSKEQNLEAYLENSQLYYRSTRRISKNEELLVWYDEELSSLLGFNEIKAQRPQNGKCWIADCRGHWGQKGVCIFFSLWLSCNNTKHVQILSWSAERKDILLWGLSWRHRARSNLQFLMPFSLVLSSRG